MVHLRPRTNIISAIARIRNALAYATHTFFQKHGFLYVIITTSDCEGAGEMFQVTTIINDAEKLEKELKDSPPPSEADLKAAEDVVKEKGEAVAQLKSAKASKQEIVVAVAELTKAKENFAKLDERYKLGERLRLHGGIPKKDGKIDYAEDFFARQAFLTVSGATTDPDSEVVIFAKRTVKDLKLPPGFVTQIAQSIQTQLSEFRSYEGQDIYTGEKIVPIKLDLRVNHTLIKDHFLWDLNNFESDPEEFAKIFCKDMGIEDPEVGPAVAIAIREQLYEIAVQNVTSIRESRINKKGRRGFEHSQASKTSGNDVDLFKLFGSKSSVIWKWKEWDVYEPVVDLLSNEEVDALPLNTYKDKRMDKWKKDWIGYMYNRFLYRYNLSS